ncbi:hypothetical protein BN59_03619 [Legionella massiliensis]|uniref:Uncharacterized protein n=1 Tax=Legionella massiliensis TaxID=1034943 RepID=A0A078L281_9GAMM|nr:hypothetical protein [Legionella massiliensis]CDZ79301.1 hypothetical protein BN59_03619 [Legionella massiliensis]CEE15039.1 hypothetical protein BN1094_03619 [Legionella massiliensis]
MSNYSPVWPHGQITKVFEGIYVVRGTNITHFEQLEIQHSRNMTIIENDGELTLINTLRLNESGLSELEQLGKVKHVLSIGAFHGRDDSFYLDRYHAKLWAVHPQEKENGNRQQLQNSTYLPIKNGQFFIFKNASPAEGFVYLSEEEGIIINCDSIKNWVAVDEYFSEDTAKLAQASGEIAKARISPIWLKATGVQKADFDSLLKLKFKHLISAHGDVLRDTAYLDVKNSVDRLGQG